MAECTLKIPYGVPETGATEYSLNTGRELFRCGTSCVKMFITNVAMEISLIKFVCGDITDAGEIEGMCVQSLNGSWKDRMVINWIGKAGVDSSYDSGTVINRIGQCQGEAAAIYTHTEGTISTRAQFPIEGYWTAQKAIDLGNFAVGKLSGLDDERSATIGTLAGNNGEGLIFSDMNTNVSQTDWQGGGANFQLFGIRNGGTGITNEEGYRISFNYQNGQGESSASCTAYDDTDDIIPVADMVSTLIGKGCERTFG